MNSIGRDIFKAVHEGKMAEYRVSHKQGSITKYWIGIYDIDTRYKSLHVEGLNIGSCVNKELTLYIDGIVSTKVVDGTYQPVNQRLVEDIKLNPHKYAFIFTNTANLKILNYLADCNKMDCIPISRNIVLLNVSTGQAYSRRLSAG